jgi:hypothetical protein
MNNNFTSRVIYEGDISFHFGEAEYSPGKQKVVPFSRGYATPGGNQRGFQIYYHTINS